MSDIPDPAELKQRLWREIEHARTGMLGLAGGPPRHLQPMTAFVDEAKGAVWFFCRRDNDLVREGGAGHAANFCVMSKDHHFIACVQGDLIQDHDRARIDGFWNPVVAAWFPEGKDDLALTLLRLDPADAQVWISQGNVIRFGFEVVKANLTKTLPDMGGKADLSF